MKLIKIYSIYLFYFICATVDLQIKNKFGKNELIALNGYINGFPFAISQSVIIICHF